MSASPISDKEVLKEGGFIVELSNRGNKLMFNPNPQNLQGNIIKCKFPGCNRQTKTIFGLCTEHNTFKGKKEVRHIADWFARLIPPGYDRDQTLIEIMPHPQITEILIKWMKEDEERQRITDGFAKDVLESVVGNVPDATYLQKSLRGDVKGIMTPDGLIEMTNGLVDRHFPKESYHDVKLDGGNFKGKSLADVPIRVVAALLILAWACEESNRGDAWFCKKKNRVSRYGNAYMPSVYYFLRRYTNATDKQARICLRG